MMGKLVNSVPRQLLYVDYCLRFTKLNTARHILAIEICRLDLKVRHEEVKKKRKLIIKVIITVIRGR